MALSEVRGRNVGIKDRNISATAGIRPYKLDQGYKFAYDDFSSRVQTSLATGAATSGTTGATNLMSTNNLVWEYHVKGAGQTITTPVLESDGLEIALDKTDDEGAEYTLGITSRSRCAFTIGTHEFYGTMKFKVADVSGTDDCLFGFRKTQAYDADVDTYTDLAAVNVILGDIKLETNLNDAASPTVTDTTLNWADGDTKTVGVFVDKGGNVRYEIDGAAPTTTAAFKFDSGDVVVPFFYFLHATTSPGKVHFVEFNCGLIDADVR
jgi:hypothetical protein